MKTNSTTSKTTSTEDRALSLLASGLAPARVAEAVGVDISRISQLMSEESFKSKLNDAKFENLNKHNEHDAELDSIESTIVRKISENIDSMYKPMELLRALQVLNAAKRRGSSAPAQITEQSTLLNLLMPVKIINNFTTNVNNQVVKAGETDLITIQASSLESRLKGIEAERVSNYGREQIASPE